MFSMSFSAQALKEKWREGVSPFQNSACSLLSFLCYSRWPAEQLIRKTIQNSSYKPEAVVRYGEAYCTSSQFCPRCSAGQCIITWIRKCGGVCLAGMVDCSPLLSREWCCSHVLGFARNIEHDSTSACKSITTWTELNWMRWALSSVDVTAYMSISLHFRCTSISQCRHILAGHSNYHSTSWPALVCLMKMGIVKKMAIKIDVSRWAWWSKRKIL